jgi:hypothetical protein
MRNDYILAVRGFRQFDLSGNSLWKTTFGRNKSMLDIVQSESGYLAITKHTKTLPFEYKISNVNASGVLLDSIEVKLDPLKNNQVSEIRRTNRGLMLSGIKNLFDFEAWIGEVDLQGKLLKERVFTEVDFQAASPTSLLFGEMYLTSDDVTVFGSTVGRIPHSGFIGVKMKY